MAYSKTISLECPHCETKCQFLEVGSSHNYCKSDSLHHIAYICTHCEGIVVTRWKASTREVTSFQSSEHYHQQLIDYYPSVSDWKPRINLSLINKDEVRSDFKEAIDCYNSGFYNACMVMARRTIQQEVINNEAKGDNLYQQIESTGISEKLKILLQKVKNFGNYGAHPDFFLFDNEGQKIDDKKKSAKLSLEFLDRYFSDQYEIDVLVEGSPKSKQELKRPV